MSVMGGKSDHFLLVSRTPVQMWRAGWVVLWPGQVKSRTAGCRDVSSFKVELLWLGERVYKAKSDCNQCYAILQLNNRFREFRPVASVIKSYWSELLNRKHVEVWPFLLDLKNILKKVWNLHNLLLLQLCWGEKKMFLSCDPLQNFIYETTQISLAGIS